MITNGGNIMDFLDNACSIAKEAIEIVSKKTNEVVTTQKQKFSIASLKNKRSKNFERLGQIFYKQIGGAEIDDEKVDELVSQINEQNEQIALLEKELEA